MRKNIPVTIGHWEYWDAVNVANIRMAISNEAKLNHASTYQRGYMRRLHQEVIGRCGEVAFCQAMNIDCPTSVNTFHAIPDVGVEVEIRATARDTGRLIVRDNDPDDRWYILVTGKPPHLTIRGCIKGIDAKKDQWLRNPHGHRPAWFVPQKALLPIPGRLAKSA